MDLDESFYNSVHFVTLYLVFSFQGLAAELEHAFLHIMTPAARKCSINKSVWSLYIWYLRPWICLFAHANLAKLIFMELLRQTVFILTNEHKWEKNLWYLITSITLHELKKTHDALGFTEFPMLFLKWCLQNQVPYSDMRIQTWSIDIFFYRNEIAQYAKN